MFVALKFVAPLSLPRCEDQWKGPPKASKDSPLVMSYLSIPPVNTGSCHWFFYPMGVISGELWLKFCDMFMSLPIGKEKDILSVFPFQQQSYLIVAREFVCLFGGCLFFSPSLHTVKDEMGGVERISDF